MNCYDLTTQYYARWLAVDPASMGHPGIRAVYSIERNATQRGYSRQFDLYVLRRDKATIISYGDRASAGVAALERRAKPDMPLEELAEAIAECYGQPPGRQIKFVFGQLPDVRSCARPLTAQDYALFEAFFVRCNPDCADKSWLSEYFSEIVAGHYAFGVFEDGVLVSATEAPSMPYMADRVQEIGINTLAEYRRQGYARMACAACVESMLSRGICPLWSTSHGNTASQQLAHSIGFARFADVLTLSL